MKPLTKKCKRIKKSVVKREIKFDDYVQCLFSGEKQMKLMKIIKSENHDVYSKEVNKIALSNEDDKREVFEDRVNTLALRELDKDKKNGLYQRGNRAVFRNIKKL